MEKAVDINKISLFASGALLGSSLIFLMSKVKERQSESVQNTHLSVPDEEDKPPSHDFKNHAFNTRAIHCGWDPYKDPHGVMVPGIDLSTTYAQTEPACPLGPFDYVRCGNPTRQALEDTLCQGIYPAKGEEGRFSMLFSTHSAAANCLFQLLGRADVLFVPKDFWTSHVYPNIEILLTFLQQSQQFAVQEIDMNDKTSFKNILNEGQNSIKMIYIPTLGYNSLEEPNFAQIRTTVSSSSNKQVLIVADNSLITGAKLDPSEHADIILDDLTGMDGIGDVKAGSLVTNSRFLYEKLFFINKSVGDTPPPLDIYFIHRGFKTLWLRKQKQIDNAKKIQEFLEENSGDKIGEVKRRYNVIVIQTKTKLKHFKLIGEGFEGLKSVAIQTENKIRIWVGCEDAEYLIADLYQASQ